MNQIICGDALTVLRRFPDETVNCCICSPPYFGLRDYLCNGQIGVEQTPELYIASLTEIFREVKRVLRFDGCMFVNIGDSYAGSGREWYDPNRENRVNQKQRYGYTEDNPIEKMPKTWHKIKKKDLVGVPWMLAFALRDDGWYLRSDIIWVKSNPMPESTRDRPSSSYEHIFLFAKSSKYYYDSEAVKQPVAASTVERMKHGVSGSHKYSGGVPGQPVQKISKLRPNRAGENVDIPTMRNMRDVITTSTNSYRCGHFAAYPADLIKPLVLAGCPSGGVVLDPFFGSGTTGVAAVLTGRKYIGIDLNPEYCNMAQQRVSQYTDEVNSSAMKGGNDGGQ